MPLQESHENNVNFQCRHCDFHATEKKYVDIHIKKVHDKIKFIMCNYCTFKATNITQIIIHGKQVHEQNRNSQCSQRQMEFSTNGSVTQHVTGEHNKRKEFECDKRKNDNLPSLKRHVRSETATFQDTDIANRNPICLSEHARQIITPHHESLLRKGGKFCPTP